MKATQKTRIAVVVLAFLVIAASLTYYAEKQNNKQEEETVITIGIVADPHIQDINTNYYKLWLEAQTGLKLSFCMLPKENTAEYLDRMFRSGNITIDALFSFPSSGGPVSVNSTLQEYGQLGYLIPLNKYIDNSKVMDKVFAESSEYNLKKVMTSADGNLYYMPGLDNSIEKKYSQIFWINKSWLKVLGLQIPQTLGELREVLFAFRNGDPNGNGRADEIALAGSMDSCSEQSYQFIINSFLYNDPENSYMTVQNGNVVFAPASDEWREAMQYLHDLYKDGLLDPFQFTLDHRQLVQLANDPRDLLGAFTSASITDVLLQSSPEIVSNYVRVAPLTKEDGEKPYATVKTPMPEPNGVITAGCKDPEAVFRLFELMLSEKAFLIGRYGEEGVDWDYAETGDTNALGEQATLRVNNQLWNKVQNKHLMEFGPFLTSPQYADGVTWNGLQADQEYMDARTYQLYSQFAPDEYIHTIFFEDNAENLREVRNNIDRYTNTKMEEFICGRLDPYDDAVWNRYLHYYEVAGIDRLVDAVQISYDSLLQN